MPGEAAYALFQPLFSVRSIRVLSLSLLVRFHLHRSLGLSHSEPLIGALVLENWKG